MRLMTLVEHLCLQKNADKIVVKLQGRRLLEKKKKKKKYIYIYIYIYIHTYRYICMCVCVWKIPKWSLEQQNVKNWTGFI